MGSCIECHEWSGFGDNRVCAYCEEFKSLRSKLSAAEKERDSLEAKLAVAVEAIEYLEQAPFGHDFRTSAKEALKAINKDS